jgi:transposase
MRLAEHEGHAPRHLHEYATRISRASKEVPVQEVARALREQPVVHADETGWYEHSKRAWLWAAVTSHLALFLIRASRGAKVAKELLGATFAGILVSDR